MTSFKIYTPDSAPEKSRGILKEIAGKLGFVPNVLGAMAEAPYVLKGWWDLKSASDQGQFSAVERRVVHLSTSYLNDCGYCIAAGTTLGEKEGVPRDILNDLRADKPLKDQRLEQLRLFSRAALKKMGRPDRSDIDAFLKAGYNNGHVLEVMQIISLAIMGNYINHVVGVPLDKAFEANKVEPRKGDSRSSVAA